MKPFVIFALALASFGCTDTKSCKKAICTAMFASINVHLSDSTNPNLTGITTQTQLTPLGLTIHTQTEPSTIPAGGFTIADDSDLKELGFNTIQNVELKISKDGNLIKTVPFTITTDCCHVSKSTGPEEVSLN